jgi:CPA2 family monovalent cation:H+ antiporter-2
MHNLDLILTLTGSLTAALALGYLTHRLGLSPLVGYLLAGIAVGPYTPGFVANREVAEQLAEIGVILLMFGVGLHFHLKELLAVQRIALPGAILQSLVATVLGAVVGRGFGWDWPAGIVFGLALSVASTVVLLRVLTDYRDLHTPTGHIAVGWLVVEDLFTVLVLVLLPALFSGQPAGLGSVPLALGLAVLKLTALVACIVLVGGRLIPWLLERVAATHSRELFTLTVLVLALGMAVGAAKLFGVSMALGAFLAGMVVGRSEFSLRAASEALPMRDAFAVLFFVAVGMLLDPRHLLAAPGLVMATLGVILLGKPLAALGLVLLLGYPLKVALAVAVALAQIGEFSFLLATLGAGLGLLPEAAINTIVAAAIVSITLNPLLYRLVDPVAAWGARRPRLGGWLNARARQQLPSDTAALESTSTLSPHHQAVVVGYGPVGQTVTRLLHENDIDATVIELNRDTVRRLHESGVAAVYGDASHRETLQGAGVERAGSLILSAAGMHVSAEVIRLARELNPDIRVLARAVYVREILALRQAGAESVFAGEAEVALAMTEVILRELGATPEQIERERARVHTDLLGGPMTAVQREKN